MRFDQTQKKFVVLDRHFNENVAVFGAKLIYVPTLKRLFLLRCSADGDSLGQPRFWFIRATKKSLLDPKWKRSSLSPPTEMPPHIDAVVLAMDCILIVFASRHLVGLPRLSWLCVIWCLDLRRRKWHSTELAYRMSDNERFVGHCSRDLMIHTVVVKQMSSDYARRSSRGIEFEYDARYHRQIRVVDIVPRELLCGICDRLLLLIGALLKRSCFPSTVIPSDVTHLILMFYVEAGAALIKLTSTTTESTK